MSRKITILGIRGNHQGKRSFVTLDLVLEYLKGQPVESIEISPYVARRLAEEAIISARIVEDLNAERDR